MRRHSWPAGFGIRTAFVLSGFNRRNLVALPVVFYRKGNKTMKKNAIRVALTFATLPKDQLNSLLILLLVCLKNNPLFPNLPVTYAALSALVADYQAKMAAADVGGEIDTAAFQEARDAVVAALRQIAGYITSLGLTNASDVLS